LRYGTAAPTLGSVKRKGMVYLVGAGPGGAGLLTLRGAEVLRRADVLVHEPGADPDILRLAPSGIECLHPEAYTAEIEALVLIIAARAREGKTVVRLFPGDPGLNPRATHEAEALAKSGVLFEIVPGIPAITAVPTFAGTPPARGVQPGAATLTLDQADGLAGAQPTRVVAARASALQSAAHTLLTAGMPANTPVCLICHGATERQQTVEGTLGALPAMPGLVPADAEVVLVAGEMVQSRDRLNWFEKRPLFGQRVVVTRSREQAGKLSQCLREHGAEVLEVPTIKTVLPTDPKPLVEALLGLHEYDWLVFTSVNGVAHFFDYFFKSFQDLRDLGGVRLAAVGPATAARLKELHLIVDAMPEEALGRNVARALAAQGSIENLRVCLLRAEAANPELPKLLEDAGAIVDDVACYKTVPDTEDSQAAAARLREAGAGWITFTSGSTVENFHTRFNLPDLLQKFTTLRTASIGPETTKALAALSVQPAVEAREHTIEGLVRAMEQASRK
jgi:uroporphyrinogen III methyltransferase / synthase